MAAAHPLAPAARRLPPDAGTRAETPGLLGPERTRPETSRLATALAPLDALLDGGFPRGQLSELVGPRTSGRTRLSLGLLAAVTGRGGWAALVDVVDGLDPASAAALGVTVDRLLWVRCGGQLSTAWPAADVLVRSGGFELVVVDLGDLPPWTLMRTAPAVFVRLQRAVESTAAVVLLVGPRRIAGSQAAAAIGLERRRLRWAPGGPGLFTGIEVDARLIRSRARAPGASVRLAWTA